MKNYYLYLFIFITLMSCTLTKTTQNNNDDKKSDYEILVNHTWILTDDSENLKNYNGKDITLKFDMSQNLVGGFSGCNQYNCGNFTLDENGDLKFGDFRTTKKYCPDSNIEKSYMDLLENVTHYKIVNGGLNLYKDNLLLLTYIQFLE